MKNITLSIPDGKFDYFLKLIQKMDFVKVVEKDLDIPAQHKEILDKRLKEHNEMPEEGRVGRILN